MFAGVVRSITAMSVFVYCTKTCKHLMGLLQKWNLRVLQKTQVIHLRSSLVGETTIHMPISALALWRTSFCPAAEQQQVYAEPPLLSQTPHRTCLIIVNLQAHVRILSPPYRWDTHKDCQSHPHQGFLLAQRSRLARPPLPKTQLPPRTHTASSK